MPEYDYVCENPECPDYLRVFGIVQYMHEEKWTRCEKCRAETLRRLIGKGSHVTIVGSHKSNRNAAPGSRNVRS